MTVIDVKLVLHILVYCVTGAIQPTLIDYVAHSHKTEASESPFTLFPVLATAIGMTMVYPIYEGLVMRLYLFRRRCLGEGASRGGGEMLLMTRKPPSSILLSAPLFFSRSDASSTTTSTPSPPPPYRLAVLDLVSSSLVIVGLVYVGAATYTVIYSSAAAFTAVIGRRYFKMRALNGPQSLGIALVTLGLVVNGLAHALEDGGGGGEEEERAREFGISAFAFGAALLLVGTVLHSVVMLLIDVHARGGKTEDSSTERSGKSSAATVASGDHDENDTRSLRLASELGRIEVAILVAWNALRWFLGYPSLFTLPLRSWIFYSVLTLNAALHVMAFFSFIGRLGAVGSSVLKGFLSLFVFGLAGYLFCERSHTEECLTPAKSASMLMVFAGGVVYSFASSKYFRINGRLVGGGDCGCFQERRGRRQQPRGLNCISIL